KVLSERNRETFDVIELEYGEFSQDFSMCNGYRVNPKTKELEFSYPTNDDLEVEQPYRPSLALETEKLKEENVLLQEYLVDVDFRLAMMQLGFL
ncbi:MAG: hypothetical protein ABS939_25070, partial [Psychrobacillus sp.]